jgi:FRG domain
LSGHLGEDRFVKPTELTLRSVSSIVSYIEEECSEHKNILFRGQRSQHPLSPGIARMNPLYRDKANRPDFLHTESRLLETFKMRSLPFLELMPETQWDWLAVAQHYGLKTRLLDWSLNALASVWFAVHKEPKGSSPGVLWILKPEERHYLWTLKDSAKLNPFDVAKTYIIGPRYLAKRIVAQKGYFTSHAFSTSEYRFIPLEEDPDFFGYLTKVEIPAESFSEIRYDMNRLGINALSLFPGLDGLCQELNWYYSWMEDEQYFPPNAKLPRSPKNRPKAVVESPSLDPEAGTSRDQ